MLAVARRAHPGLWFAEGSMEGVADGALSGVLAWYSIIHTPPARLPDKAASPEGIPVAPTRQKTLCEDLTGGRLMISSVRGARDGCRGS